MALQVESLEYNLSKVLQEICLSFAAITIMGQTKVQEVK
jgi:hypothetical protein